MKFRNKDFIILNVYTPFECQQNKDEYLNRLAFIQCFICDNNSSSVYVVDLSDGHSLFAKHMLQFCDDNNLKLSSQLLLPADSFSDISDAWHTTSWLDHCISTTEAHAIVRSRKILYDASLSDHVPSAQLNWIGLNLLMMILWEN